MNDESQRKIRYPYKERMYLTQDVTFLAMLISVQNGTNGMAKNGKFKTVHAV